MEQQHVAALPARPSALDRAVERASVWLLKHVGQEVEWAIEDQFLIGLDEQERIDLEKCLRGRSVSEEATFFDNAMSCLIAEGRYEPGPEEGGGPAFSFANRLLGEGGVLLEATERRWLEALVGRELCLYRVGRREAGLISLEEVTRHDRVQVEVHPVIDRLEPGDLLGARVVTLSPKRPSLVCGVFDFPTGEAERDLVNLVETAAAHARTHPDELLSIAEVVATAWLHSLLPPPSARGRWGIMGGGAVRERRVLQWPVSAD